VTACPSEVWQDGEAAKRTNMTVFPVPRIEDRRRAFLDAREWPTPLMCVPKINE
jgi:hypothetical protein